MKRYVLEGTWSGYTSSQERAVHREVVPGSRKTFLAWIRDAFGIRYTDGTMLYLTVRECKPRERVQPINGYKSLIEDCFFYGVTGVAELTEARKSFRNEQAALRQKEGGQ